MGERNMIRDTRVAGGWTLGQVAAEAGMSRQALSALELGKGRMRRKTVEKVMSAMRRLGGEPRPEPSPDVPAPKADRQDAIAKLRGLMGDSGVDASTGEVVQDVLFFEPEPEQCSSCVHGNVCHNARNGARPPKCAEYEAGQPE